MRQPLSFRSITQGGRKGAATTHGWWLALLLVAACSVDDRALMADDATGGLGSAGGGASGLGAADAGAGGDAPLPLCDYAGTAGDPGCETVVENPGFATDVAGWLAEDVGVKERWLAAQDANDHPDSGSLEVTNSNYSDEDDAKAGTAGGGARQCIALNGGTQLDLAADVFIPKGQGAGFMGTTYVSVATLSVFFYSEAGCVGQNSSNFTSHPVQTEDEWVHVAETARLPLGAHSVAVRLATLKPFRQFSFQAQFDNVYVRER